MSKGSHRQIPMSREQVPGLMVKIDFFLTFDGELRQKPEEVNLVCLCPHIFSTFIFQLEFGAYTHDG